MHLSRRASQMIALLVLAAFFGAGLLFVRSGSERPRTTMVESPSSDPTPEPTPLIPEAADSEEGGSDGTSFSLSDFHRSETRDGKVLWEISGKNAEYVPGGNTVELEECALTLRTSDKPIQIASRFATLALKGPLIAKAVLTEDVVVVWNDEVTITTDEATYHREENRVTAPGTVSIRGSWYEIDGTRLEGDLESDSFKLFEDVSTVLDPRKKES